jgi:mono/diheme cytochrome c family protein
MAGRKHKRLAIALGGAASAIIIGAVGCWAVATRTPASPFDGAGEPVVTPALVQHGAYVARAADCVACHSLPSGPAFAGGLKMPTPLGAIYATNITPDAKTGIGAYTLAEFDRALRHGVARDGHRLYPAMPYPSYARMTDGDVRALYVYFKQGVKPVAQANHQSDIPWPLNMRWPLAIWNLLFGGPGEPRPDLAGDPLWSRGAYLVQGPGHCGACHTPRGLAMNEKGLDERSRSYLAGAEIDGWYAPSLRGDHNLGLARWSEDDIARFLKSGRNSHGVVFGSMTDVVNNSTQFLTGQDAQAIARYLKSLPGDAGRDGAPWRYEVVAFDGPAGDTPGARTYRAKCAFCHGLDGKGQAPWMSPLAGTASSMSRNPASTINITLNGSGRVVAGGVPDAYHMPAFRAQLSDREMAEVVSFVRTSWGNQGGEVSAKAVATARAATRPASSVPALLPTQ